MKHRSPTAPPSKVHPDLRKKQSRVKARGRIMQGGPDWDVPTATTIRSTGKKTLLKKEHDDRVNSLLPLLLQAGVLTIITALPHFISKAADFFCDRSKGNEIRATLLCAIQTQTINLSMPKLPNLSPQITFFNTDWSNFWITRNPNNSYAKHK